MRKVFQLFCVVLLLISASAGNLTAQQATTLDTPKLNEYLQLLQDEDKFMGSVAVAREGELVFNQAYGLSQKNPREMSADDATIYRIGSITKTFTAAMVMQLVEENKLTLSQKLSHFFPKIAGADAITIRHLLAHQSGLYNFTNSEEYPKWMTEQRSKEQMLELFRTLELQFDPGDRTTYSNTNYVLLGYIIEEVTGESYASQLQDRIAEPLDLTHTYYGDGIDPTQNEAVSFNWNGSGWQEAPETDMSIPHGAGAIVSTSEELTTFIRSLFQGEVVSEESLDEMTDIDQRMGLGLMRFPFHDKLAYGHNGGIDGFQSNMAYFPEQDVSVAITANALNYSLNELLIGVLSITFGRDFELPSFEQVTLSEQQKQQFTGTYSSGELPMNIEIFEKNGQLFVQATGQQALPLTASSATTLKADVVSLVMEFESLSDGKYASFTLEQGGVTAIYKRKQEQ